MHKQRDFKENLTSSFGELRDGHDFSDVTLACNDGTFLEAHKVVLASSSAFFGDFLNRNKHPQPFLFIRGTKGDELSEILDILYRGEENVRQDNLDRFLALSKDMKLQGLPKTSDEDGEAGPTIQLEKTDKEQKAEEKLDFNITNKKGEFGVMEEPREKKQHAFNRHIKIAEFCYLIFSRVDIGRIYKTIL